MSAFSFSKIQQFSAILWPSFVVSGIANAVFFSLFDPKDLLFAANYSAIAVYSMGFLFLWTTTGLTAIFTCYYLRPCALINKSKR